jgi:6-pyruvoyltetrahydropterin/6-carboxytetrahydropterin synthase
VRKDLLDGITSRVKELDKGGYARVYRRGGREYPTGLHALVGQILDAAGVSYKDDEPIFPGSERRADFVVGDRLIVIGRDLSAEERSGASSAGRECTVITQSDTRSDAFDTATRVRRSGDPAGERVQTIFLDDPSFNFDYAHILPKTEKCSVMHGHTSSVLVELAGATTRDGMVVDFNDAKPVIREAVRSLDHKLFISDRYVVGREGSQVRIGFETVHGPFEMRVPVSTTVLLEEEATVENLAQELLRRIAPGMPGNVESVGVYVYEGLNKGTHLLAQVHRREVERGIEKKSRKKGREPPRRRR